MADAADEAKAEVCIEAAIHNVVRQDVEHIKRRALLRIGAIRGHRIVHVHERQDARKFADLRFLQGSGVA